MKSSFENNLVFSFCFILKSIYGAFKSRFLAIWILVILFSIGTQKISGNKNRYQEFVTVKGPSSIPMSGITSLIIDDYGFVWGASRMGIIRSTPTDTKKYDLPSSTSDVMQMKLSYNKGELVAATQNGKFFRYDKIKDEFVKWFSMEDIMGNSHWISNFFIDENGLLWISTSAGLYTYENGELSRQNDELNGYTYILSCSGAKMFVLADNGLYLISNDTKKTIKLPGKFEKLVSSATYDKYQNRILIGTYKGELWEYRLNDKKLSRLDSKSIPELIVRSIIVPDSDIILLGMEGGGIIMLDSKADKVISVVREDMDNPVSLKGNSIFAMTSDDQGRLWVATTSMGLQYSDVDSDEAVRIVHRHNSASSLFNNEINYLLIDRDKNLWVATNDGISRKDAKDGSWRHLYGNRQLSVLSITQDIEERIYATTYGEGVYVLDPKTCSQLNHFTENSSAIFGKGSYVFASFMDSEGDIWFGGVKGNIVCYSPESGKFREYESHPVFCFGEGKKGKILTGGGDGLIAIDKKTGKTEIILDDNVVQQILVDDALLWICTSGNGVIRLDCRSGEMKSLCVKDGLNSNFTRSVIKQDGKLWIGTALGMNCYDIEKNVMLQLVGKDIFYGDPFRENSSCVFPNGNLAFGTNNGIVSFDPRKILEHKSQGKIFFSDIRVSGRSIRKDFDKPLTEPIDSIQELVLNYPSNSFTLSLIPLGNVGSNVMYSWKLEKVDKNWTERAPIPFINYVNLDPGKYVLKIRMYEGRIVAERELIIKVNPPFWNTIWFRTILIVFILSIIMLCIRHYIVSMQRRNAFEKLLLSLQISENVKRLGVSSENEVNYRLESQDKPEEESESEENSTIQIIPAENEDIDMSQSEPTSTDFTVINDEFLIKAMDCVKENISNEAFGKGEFALAMNISQSLLYKKIKARTNMSVIEFIRSIRLSHAMALLQSGKYNVTEVSEMCGFSSSAYFSRVFKEFFSKSPSDVMPRSL